MKNVKPVDLRFGGFSRQEWIDYIRFEKANTFREYYSNMTEDFTKLMALFTWANVNIVSFSILYIVVKVWAFPIVSVIALFTGLGLIFVWGKHKRARENQVKDYSRILDTLDQRIREGELQDGSSIYVCYKGLMDGYNKKYKLGEYKGDKS